MGKIVEAKSSPEKTKIAAELTARLAGYSLTDVKRREYDWSFGFADNAGLGVGCPWRILVDGRIAHADSDDGEKFGLPAPVDGEERTRRLLGQKIIQKVTIRTDTGDLSIDFSDLTTLEVINMSSGYEGWHINAGSFEVIGLGGGNLAILATEPNIE